MHRALNPIILVLTCALTVTSATAAPLNIVLIIADDYGWADCRANNPDSFYETPNLDRLAASGVNFARGYAASPVCSPTRFSIISGVNPTVDAATEWFSEGPARSERFLSADRINHLPTARPTIAERLRPAGYETFFAGKWHLGGDARHLPQNRGFDVNIAGSAKGNPGWRRNGRGGFFAPYADFIGLDAPEGEHLPARLTDETINWIAARDGSRPFLAVLSYYSVHTPLQGREDLVEKYRGRRAALGLDDDARFDGEEQVWADKPERAVRVKQDHAVYAAMVEAMDEQIGRLLDAIDEQGLRERTVVVFVSDNGGLSTSEGSPTSNLPLRGGKGWLYEGGIRVPFMLRWPGVTAEGAAVGTPVHTSDIVPTILDAAGIARDAPDTPANAPLEGRSLRDSLVPFTVNRDLRFHYPHYANQGGFPGGALIRGDMKYVLRYEDGRDHLYDLSADPSEQTDLSDTNPGLAADMRRDLLAWLGRHHARFLGTRPGGPAPWQPRGE